MSTYFGNCGSTSPFLVSDRKTSAKGALNAATTFGLPVIAGTAAEAPEVKAICPSGPHRYYIKAQAASFSLLLAFIAKPAPPRRLEWMPVGPAGSGATAHL